MQINSLSPAAYLDGDWCGTGRPRIPLPKPEPGPWAVAGSFVQLGDDYCGNGRIPIPPKPHGPSLQLDVLAAGVR
jgi:hypothetical protein